jgi:hypothetical protein
VKRYPPSVWIDLRIEIRASPVAGRGLFARAPVRAGDPVISWGGWACTGADVAAGRGAPGSPLGRIQRSGAYPGSRCSTGLMSIGLLLACGPAQARKQHRR